jgi:hypothetical protein
LVNDRLDVHMEYKSSQITSQSWYFTDLNDSRLNISPSNASNVSIDPNNTNRIITGGGEVIDNGDTRTLFEIETNTPYSETKVANDHLKFKAQRSIMTETDWTNFEVTLYAEFMNVNSNSELFIYGRSGKHLLGRPCEGTFYRVGLRMNGYMKCESKYWHPGGLNRLDPNINTIGDVEGMRIGIKFIVFTNKDGASTTIRAMVDMNGDNSWSEMCYVIDTGEKNSLAFQKCGDETTKVITWGGPLIGVELRNFPLNGVAIDKLSVREIDALSPKIEIPIPALPIDPEYMSPPTAPPSTTYRTDLDDDDWDDDVVYPLPTYVGE